MMPSNARNCSTNSEQNITMGEIETVKVAVRVRPLLEKEKIQLQDTTCVQLITERNQIILGPGNKQRSFTFDYAIGPQTEQADVFDNCVVPLIDKAFEGYNATVFAYGQTGSGKTYTIIGDQEDCGYDWHGIVPRAVAKLFEKIEALNGLAEIKLKVSFIELYKEELRDLLDPDNMSKDIVIREDERGNTMVMGAMEMECETRVHIMECLETGSSLRQTAATQMNAHSSRSHSIFTVVVEQTWKDTQRLRGSDLAYSSMSQKYSTGRFRSAKIHFVDLAGSERANRTGNVGERFKESICINTGLLALGNVISALGDQKKKSSHIPYRDAKITRLLKDSLGGNSMTLMIACISPASINFDETLNTLKFANRARNIRNMPVVNQDPQSIIVQKMKTQIEDLRDQLEKERTEFTGIDVDRLQCLENEIGDMRKERIRFSALVQQAYQLLVNLHQTLSIPNALSKTVREWINTVEENKDTKITSSIDSSTVNLQSDISRLQRALDQCKRELRMDEEIFSEKTRENNELIRKVTLVETNYTNAREMLNENKGLVSRQQDQIMSLQEEIDGLLEKLQHQPILSTDKDGVDISVQVTNYQLTPRPGTPKSLLADANYGISESAFRKTKSAPTDGPRNAKIDNHINRPHTAAIFTLEKMFQGFRARSHFLIQQIEDNDEVAIPTLPGDDRIANIKLAVQTPGYYAANSKSKDTHSKSIVSNKSNDIERLRESTESDGIQVRKSEKEIKLANRKMKELAINIRLKEELIREMVKSEKQSERLNNQYKMKIDELEKQYETARQELSSAQKAFQGLEDSKAPAGKDKLEKDYRRRLDLAKQKVAELQRKLKEAQSNVSSTANEKKISELDGEIFRLRSAQELLQKRFKEETDRKSRIERDLNRDQQKIKALETRNNQQQKVLRRKTEELAVAQRKLRQAPVGVSNESRKLEEQRKWMDTEVDKVLKTRQRLDQLDADLKLREAKIVEKEMLLKQQSALHMKKAREEKVIQSKTAGLLLRIDEVEDEIVRTSMEVNDLKTPRNRKEELKVNLKQLDASKEKLVQQRDALDERLAEGLVLSDMEERKLIELDEGIDALEAAIDYKTDIIANHQDQLRSSKNQLRASQVEFQRTLHSIQGEEAGPLLTKMFDKIIDLRDNDRKQTLESEKRLLKIDEQYRSISDLEFTLENIQLDFDRKITVLQKQHEKRVQGLMKHVASEDASSSVLEDRISELEKDLYYYKKTSRELKKKLRDVLSAGGDGAAGENLHESRLPSIEYRRPSIDSKLPLIDPKLPGTSSSKQLSSLESPFDSSHSLPVRKSKKDLRELSSDEVQSRRSQTQDSLDSIGNQWPS